MEEENRLVIRKKDIFSKIRVIIVSLFKREEMRKNMVKRDVRILKKQYEEGTINLSDLTEEEQKEYYEILEKETKEYITKELYVDKMLTMAK